MMALGMVEMLMEALDLPVGDDENPGVIVVGDLGDTHVSAHVKSVRLMDTGGEKLVMLELDGSTAQVMRKARGPQDYKGDVG
jgi:hypothetical protein